VTLDSASGLDRPYLRSYLHTTFIRKEKCDKTLNTMLFNCIAPGDPASISHTVPARPGPHSSPGSRTGRSSAVKGPGLKGPVLSLICMTRPGPKGRESSHRARFLASCIADHNQRTGSQQLLVTNRYHSLHDHHDQEHQEQDDQATRIHGVSACGASSSRFDPIRSMQQHTAVSCAS
jgi:hypothetical protein